MLLNKTVNLLWRDDSSQTGKVSMGTGVSHTGFHLPVRFLAGGLRLCERASPRVFSLHSCCT